MSIRGLFSTSTSALESAVKGTVEAGKIIGNASQWAVRQSERWNNETVVKAEEIEHKAVLIERVASAVGFTSDYDENNVVEEVTKLNTAFNTIFK